MAAFEVDFFGGQDSVTDTSSGSAGVAVAEPPVAEQVAEVAAEPATEPAAETSGPGSHCATPAKTVTEWLNHHPDRLDSESDLTEDSDGDEPSGDDEENISDELREAQREFIRSSMELARAKKAQKRCQKRFDYCLEMMMDLTQDQIGGDDSDEGDGESDGDCDGPESATVAGSSPASPAEPIREVSRDEWQKVSIDQLGLKETLCEKLKEAGLDTIGRLESRRAEIYSGFEKWPKGIGQAKVTEIENAVLNWLAKNRQDDDKITTAGDGELADSVDPDSPDTTEPVGETITQEPVPPVPINPDIFESGRQAYDQNANVDECPWTPGVEADSWIAGWNSAQAEDEPKPKAAVVTDLLEGL